MLQNRACKVYSWQVSFFFSNSMNQIVMLSMDRVLAILLPFKHRTLNFSKVSKCSCWGVTFAILILTSPFVLFANYVQETELCAITEAEQFVIIYRLLVAAAVPALVLIGCNAVFVKALIKRRRQRLSRVPNCGPSLAGRREERQAEKQQKEESYIRMLLTTSVAFVALLFLSIGLVNWGLSLSKAEETLPMGQLLVSVGGVVFALNHSVNFIFYYMSGEMFREAFTKAFTKLLSRQPPAVTSNTN